MTYYNLLKEINKKPFLWRCFAIFFVNGFPNALSATSLVLIFFSPKVFHCSFPNDVTNNLQKNSSQLNATLDYFLPFDADKNKYESCLIYNRSSEDVANFILNNYSYSNVLPNLNINLIKHGCGGKYDFEKVSKGFSASTEFGYLCDRSWMKPFVLLLYFSGKTGSGVAGFLADKFGRRIIFNISTLMIFLTMFIQSFAQTTWTFAAASFFQGFSAIVNYLVGFVLGVEYTTPENRNFVSISSFVSFSIGYSVTSLIGYLTPNWRWLCRVNSLIGLIFIANFWFIYESPRWLLTNGKTEEAKAVFQEMAKVNNETLSSEFLSEVEEHAERLVKDNQNKEEKNEMWKTFKETFKKPRILLIVGVFCYSWLANTIIYYGISLNVQALSGNLYLNNSLMGLVEIPGLLLAFLGVKYLSRPIFHGGSVTACAVFCLTAALFYEMNPVASSVSSLIGKGLISGSFYLVYIHTTEAFPTVIRSIYMTILAGCGTFGNFISPFIIYLGDIYGYYVPYILMSILTATAGLAAILFLPETNHVELPETTEDVMKMKTYCPCINKRRKASSSL